MAPDHLDPGSPMNPPASGSPLPNPGPVDLSATQRRLRLAREQCAAQSSTEQIRAATLARRWRTPDQRRSERTS
jgi:hypothetical protein